MRTCLTIIATLSCSIPMLSMAAPASFIGREVPPGPAGCERRDGMMLGKSGQYGYSHYRCADSEIVLFERFRERRGKEVRWTVTDQLNLPKPTPKRQLLDIPLCGSSSYKDEPIMAMGRWVDGKDGEFAGKDISRAWRFNLETEKIEKIPVEGVVCEGENQ